jgi:four helix bundle protein
MSIVLKELRETQINLKILKKANITTDDYKMEYVLKEVSEMVAIFQKSVNSAKRNIQSQ